MLGVPFFKLVGAGIIQQGPFSIVGGVLALFQHGSVGVAVLVGLFSVVFPIAKVTTVGVMLFHHRPGGTPKALVAALHRLGPLSMLDALVVMVLLVAYTTVPLGAVNVIPMFGFWLFIAAVLLNSAAINLANN